ncbi:MAG: sugar transferase [Bdellovibrionales bacterium]|nr:sugar transferase [Bdellovibrionales bacterium]
MNLRLSPSAFVRGKYRFLLLSALFWFALYTEFDYPPLASGLEQGWNALLAGAFTVLFLDCFGYFHSLRPFPRKSDVFLVVATAPLATVCEYFTYASIWGTAPDGFFELLFSAPFVGALIFLADYILCRYGIIRRAPKKIVVDLLPGEGFRFLRCLAEFGYGPYLELLSRSEVEQYLVENRAGEIDLIVISKSAVASFEADDLLLRCHIAGIPFVDHRALEVDISGKVSVDEAEPWSYLLGAAPQNGVTKFFWIVKKYTEPLLALLGLVVFSPVIALIALLVKGSSPGPVLYRQSRTGYLGKPFTLLKFRSMYRDSEQNGPQWCSQSDSRITPVGIFLRRTRLDELPQLVNVLKGEMSFCGPRPERPEMYARLCKEIPLFSVRTVVRPGITGWAQIRQGYAASVEESREKLEYDLYYIKHLSPRLDLICLIETAMMVCGVREKGKGDRKSDERNGLPVLEAESQPLFVKKFGSVRSGNV